MKLSELKKIVDDTLNYNPTARDCEVTVRVSDNRFPTIPSVRVRDAHKGFDWDNWQFLIDPDEALVSKSKDKK